MWRILTQSLQGLQLMREKLLLTWDSATELQGRDQPGRGRGDQGSRHPSWLAMPWPRVPAGASEDGESVCMNICPIGTRNSPLILHSVTLADRHPRLFVTIDPGWI